MAPKIFLHTKIKISEIILFATYFFLVVSNTSLKNSKIKLEMLRIFNPRQHIKQYLLEN